MVVILGDDCAFAHAALQLQVEESFLLPKQLKNDPLIKLKWYPGWRTFSLSSRINTKKGDY